MANNNWKHILVTIGSLLITSAYSQYLGYQCGDKVNNLTTISLNSVAACNIKEPEVKVEPIYAQVLQLNDFSTTRVWQCSIKITREVVRCGWMDVQSSVVDGSITYYDKISREACIALIEQRQYQLGNRIIKDIPINSTVPASITLGGDWDNSGNCNQGSYSDAFGSWSGVFVKGYVEIATKDYYAPVNLDTKKIVLRSQTQCNLFDNTCFDGAEGYAFWNAVPEDTCGVKKYGILHEGLINRTTELENSDRITYMIESDDITIALSKIGMTHLCGYPLMRTEHPKLFIMESNQKLDFQRKDETSVENFDLFAYVNSKFVYVEKYLRKQIVNMYYDLLRHKCELERKILNNALSIATQAPDEFAYRLMKGPGYMAVRGGEVVHLIQCEPVEVKFRETDECYQQLPVTLRDEKYFLMPRTRILIRSGTRVSCNKALPIMYYLNNTWVKLTPEREDTAAPEILTPETKPTWTYKTPAQLAILGLYDQRNLEKLRRRIIFPMEKGPILDSLALGASGRSITGHGITFYPMLDNMTLEKIAENTWKSLWGSFITFGTASAGILGIFIVIRIIKLLVDTIIHGFAIYTIYGWSIHLIGAVWNSVTQLLLHLGRNLQEEAVEQAKNETEKKQFQQEEKKPDKVLSHTETEGNFPEHHHNAERPYAPTLYPYLERGGGSLVNIPRNNFT